MCHENEFFLIFFLKIALAGVDVTERGCFINAGNLFDDGECQEQSFQGMTATLCVCESDLCNGVERMLPHLATFFVTTLLAYYIM